MAKMVKLMCEFCNKEFTVKKGGEKKFCSKKCRLDKRKIDDDIYYVEKYCEYCGKKFKSKKKFKQKCCSYKCSNHKISDSLRENRTCLICGIIFNERIKHERKFCSEKCRIEWQRRPENIKIRIDLTKKSNLKKYGVECTLHASGIKEKALENLRKTYKERGSEIVKISLKKVKENRQQKLIERFSKIGYTILEFKNDDLVVKHPDGHIFENNRKLLVNRLNHAVELSTILQPIGSPRTTFELKICQLLKGNNINYISNDRKIIKLELDILIPDLNCAIEIDGLYWHSECYLNDDYHLIKTQKCAEINIKLLHFFEDELIEKYDIVESIIKNNLNLMHNKIFVKECIIKEIDSKLSKEFLDNNYIQGNVNSSIRIGLFYNGELVSLMTFGKLRNVFGNKKKNDDGYEMLRFCNKLNYAVIGGAEKLFDYFIFKYSPTNIVGFTNRRYPQDDLYNKLNFKFLYNTAPNYWYVLGKERKHKFLFRKNILIKEGYDSNKTEHEIMGERKIPRIYDCGNTKYEYINKINDLS